MSRARAWIDGTVVDAAEARIPVVDHGLLYGDGVFEGIRIRKRRVFRLERHLARMETAARFIGLELPGGVDALRSIVLQTARAFGEDEAYVRLIVTRGEGGLGIDPANCAKPRIICLADRIALYPPEKLRAGLDLITSSVRRPAPDVLDPRVKSLNYLNNVLAKLEARRAHADEALLLNAAGNVAEASAANVFALRDGVLLTPPGTDGALEGVTRATVLEIAETIGVVARERTLGRFDLFASEEVFLTGSGAGIVPVRSLDGRPLGTVRGPVFSKVVTELERASERLGTPFDTR